MNYNNIKKYAVSAIVCLVTVLGWLGLVQNVALGDWLNKQSLALTSAKDDNNKTLGTIVRISDRTQNVYAAYVKLIPDGTYTFRTQIGFRRSFDHGATWEAEQIVYDNITNGQGFIWCSRNQVSGENSSPAVKLTVSGVSPDNEYVHIIVAGSLNSAKCLNAVDQERPTKIIYLRSTNQGASGTWDAPTNSKLPLPANYLAMCNATFLVCAAGALAGAEGRNGTLVFAVTFNRTTGTIKNGAFASRSTDNGSTWTTTELTTPGGSTLWSLTAEASVAVASTFLHCVVLSAEESGTQNNFDLYSVPYAAGWGNAVKMTTQSSTTSNDDEPALWYNHNGLGIYQLVWDYQVSGFPPQFTTIKSARNVNDQCGNNWSATQTVAARPNTSTEEFHPQVSQGYLTTNCYVSWAESDSNGTRVKYRRNTDQCGNSALWGSPQTITDSSLFYADRQLDNTALTSYNSYVILGYLELTLAAPQPENAEIRRNDNYGAGTATPQLDLGRFIPAQIASLFTGQVKSVAIYGLNGALIVQGKLSASWIGPSIGWPMASIWR